MGKTCPDSTLKITTFYLSFPKCFIKIRFTPHLRETIMSTYRNKCLVIRGSRRIVHCTHGYRSGSNLNCASRKESIEVRYLWQRYGSLIRNKDVDQVVNCITTALATR